MNFNNMSIRLMMNEFASKVFSNVSESSLASTDYEVYIKYLNYNF